MKVAIIQMSDLHISSDKDYIIDNARELARSVSSVLNTCQKVALVITGDIIDKGNVMMYQHAKRFLKDFKDEIQKESNLLEWQYVIVPGNHDLDFNMRVPMRPLILKECMGNGIVSEPEYLQEALKPQKEFWKFYSELIEDEKQPSISFKQIIRMNDEMNIEFHCYNTAFLSTKDEQPQGLLLPESEFINYDNSQPQRKDVVISVYHHKSSWLSTQVANNNQRRFIEHIQKQSQILMCGHEHQKDQRIMMSLENKDKVLYLESDSLQQGNKQSFTILTITDEEYYTLHKYGVSIDPINNDCTLSEEQIISIPYHAQALSFSEEHLKNLTGISAPIIHPRKPNLELEDVYVYPDLDPQCNSNDDKLYAYVDSQDILSSTEIGNVIVLEGESQCGKTSLIRMLAIQCYQKAIYPIILHGQDIVNIYVKALLDKEYKRQYDTKKMRFDKYMQLERNKRIVFIDNMDRSPLNDESRRQLWKTLLENFGLVVLTSSHNLDIKKMLKHQEGDVSVARYAIQPLGYVKRNTLIEKWVLIGSDKYTRTESQILESTRFLFDQITNVLGKELLPSNPIFVLTLLQTLDSSIKPFQITPTSYANLYQSLLFAALLNIDVPQDKLSGVVTFLSALSYEMHKKNVIQVYYDSTNADVVNYSAFYDEYNIRKIPPFKKDKLKNVLIKSKLWVEHEENIFRFSYKYLFYYLTAQHISNMIATNEKDVAKKDVSHLCEELYKENNANILIFLAYLDKSKTLLDDIRITSMIPFEKLSPITLKQDDELYVKLDALASSMKEEVLKTYTNPTQNRKDLLKKQDDEKRALAKATSDSSVPTPEEIEKDDGLRSYLESLMVTRIIGQIVKNQQESLYKEEITNLVEDAYNATFRAVSFITQLIKKEEQAIVDEFVNNSDKYKDIDVVRLKEHVAELLQRFLLMMSLISFGNLSLSVGTSGSDMASIYDDVARKIGTPAADFITFTIKTYYGNMKIDDLQKIVNLYSNNPVMLRLINFRVRSYVYQHCLEYNKIAEIGSITHMKLLDSPNKVIARKNR